MCDVCDVCQPADAAAVRGPAGDLEAGAMQGCNSGSADGCTYRGASEWGGRVHALRGGDVGATAGGARAQRRLFAAVAAAAVCCSVAARPLSASARAPAGVRRWNYEPPTGLPGQTVGRRLLRGAGRR